MDLVANRVDITYPWAPHPLFNFIVREFNHPALLFVITKGDNKGLGIGGLKKLLRCLQ